MTSGLLDILKTAILLEMHGKSFYDNAALSASNTTIKNFFRDMAEEEDKHLTFLKRQFTSLKEKNKFDLAKMEDSNSTSSLVITNELKEKINSVDYEFTAVSIAVLLERNAYRFYKDLSESTTNNDEKAIYGWLSNWEKEHLDSLLSLDKHIKERVWFDNRFWPL